MHSLRNVATSVETVRALAAVIHAEIPDALEEVTRALGVAVQDLERTRMSAEDVRSRLFSPYVTRVGDGDSVYHDPHDNTPRRLTWRELLEPGFEDRISAYEDMSIRMQAVCDRLMVASREALAAIHNPLSDHQTVLTAAWNSILDDGVTSVHPLTSTLRTRTFGSP